MTDTVSSRSVAPAGTLGFDEIMANVGRLGPGIVARREEIENLRRLPADLVADLRAAGVFRSAMPRDWGGAELTSMEQVLLVEQLAGFDASVGWCAMIGMDSGVFAGYLPPHRARELFPELDMITAGWVPPMGRAHEVEGGYLVDGHWRFGSGSSHADLISGGCAVFRDGEPVTDDKGQPLWRVILAKPSSYTMLDTWYTTGLRGSGSQDYTCERLFVPAEHSFSFDEPYRDEPLYRRSDTIVRKMSGVPLGVARAAIDHVHELAEDRIDHTGRPWRSSSHVRSVIGECEMSLAVARSGVFSSVEAQWTRLLAHQPLTARERATAALARYNAFRSALEITRVLFDLVGGAAIYQRNGPLDRHQRDMVTVCQHVVGQRRILEWAGQLLLGEEPQTPFI